MKDLFISIIKSIFSLCFGISFALFFYRLVCIIFGSTGSLLFQLTFVYLLSSIIYLTALIITWIIEKIFFLSYNRLHIIYWRWIWRVVRFLLMKINWLDNGKEPMLEALALFDNFL